MDDEHEAVGPFRERRERVRSELGGPERVARIHARGGRTVRERIDALVDPGSFEEVGTFAVSATPADRASTPGDGKIGGHATIDGRPVSVAGDDITVKRGSSSLVGSRKLARIFEHALRAGQPIVYLGETGGARIPDTLGSEGFAQVPPAVGMSLRRRRVPVATAIVGPSFGGSSFMAAHSDLVVQVRGSCLAVTSPRVIEVATGEAIDDEALGGVDVHVRGTGMIDRAAETEDDALADVRRFLSYLPSNAWTPAPYAGPPGSAGPLGPDPGLTALVPERRQRAYHMRRVLARVCDPGSVFELGAGFGRSLVCALARIDGHAIAVIASNPTFHAGALTPDAIEKATRLLCLADAFDLPVVLLQDTPGFLVGRAVEHDRLLAKAIRFQDALVQCGSPKLTVVVRKAFGLAYFALGGNDTGVDALFAWPGAEIGFMDPAVGANVLGVPAEALSAVTSPYEIAGAMKLDEIIDPADTRDVLARRLGRLGHRRVRPPEERPLAGWPTC